MQTVSGLFQSRDEANRAVHALEDAGIDADDISLILPRGQTAEPPAAPDAMQGAGVGAAVGGVGGMLAGLAAFSLPGVGPVLGAGWLVAIIAGAAAGGLAGGVVGLLVGSGIPEREAHVYAEAMRRGSILLTARVHDEDFGVAQAVLAAQKRVDVEERRRAYEADGWEGFAATDIWDADIGNEDREPPSRKGQR